MICPITKENIDRIKAGQLPVNIPVMVPGYLRRGDSVTFQEATFDLHEISTWVPQGDSVTVKLTRAQGGQPIGSSTYFAIEWDSP